MSWFNDLKNVLLPWKKLRDCCTWWVDNGWQDCCCQHDDDYKYGEIPRKQADQDLKDCVEASGHPEVSKWMYYGVRIGGKIPWINHRRRNLKREQ